MSTFNLNEFTRKVASSGLAVPSRFEVLITPPTALSTFTDHSRTVSLFCDISNLPGVSVTTKGHRIYGAAYQRPVSAEFGGEAINMTFYVDREMNTKAFFDAWIFSTVNLNSFNVSYPSDYVCQIEIRQLDQQDNVTYSILLEDAFPRAVNMLDLNMGAVNQTHKLNVTFAYRRWAPTHTLIDSIDLGPKLKNPKPPRGGMDQFN
jgi:hypothetical protein